MSAECYRKHFIPLESNPDVFTQLIHTLGVSRSLAFKDVLSIDETELHPHPALALILIFPTSDAYEMDKAKEEASREEYRGSGGEEDVMWFRQTINNACGLYSILHAVTNGNAKNSIYPNSLLANLLNLCMPLQPEGRALVLEDSKELESVYEMAALQGDSTPPTNPEEEVEFHFVCFVKSDKNGHIYELDGDRKGPVDKGVVLGPDEDILTVRGLSVAREFIKREKDGNSNFSLMALVST